MRERITCHGKRAFHTDWPPSSGTTVEKLASPGSAKNSHPGGGSGAKSQGQRPTLRAEGEIDTANRFTTKRRDYIAGAPDRFVVEHGSQQILTNLSRSSRG